MKKILAVLMALVLLASAASAQTIGLTDFETTDLEGNPVTQDIFAAYDLTMVNVWATWCGYCIEEMPAFSEIKNALPENVNIITICDDANEEPELAKEILAAAGANFQTLVPTEEMYPQLLGYVYAFPSTFFVNSQGIPIVQPITGVPSQDDLVGTYLTIIDALLGVLEG